MALILRDARVIQDIRGGNEHDVPSMTLTRKLTDDRIAADIQIKGELVREIADKIAGDKELLRQLLNEVSDRIAADNRLERLILDEYKERSADVKDLNDRLAAEIAARQNADTAINLRINELDFEDIHGMLPGTRVWAWGEPYTDVEVYPPKIARGQVLYVTEGQGIPPYKVTGTYLSNP